MTGVTRFCFAPTSERASGELGGDRVTQRRLLGVHDVRLKFTDGADDGLSFLSSRPFFARWRSLYTKRIMPFARRQVPTTHRQCPTNVDVAVLHDFTGLFPSQAHHGCAAGYAFRRQRICFGTFVFCECRRVRDDRIVCNPRTFRSYWRDRRS